MLPFACREAEPGVKQVQFPSVLPTVPRIARPPGPTLLVSGWPDRSDTHNRGARFARVYAQDTPARRLVRLVVREIDALGAAGEYLDQLLGVPGALSGGGAFLGNQRIYVRGTPEHLEACAAGVVKKLPPLQPALVKVVEKVERPPRLPPAFVAPQFVPGGRQRRVWTRLRDHRPSQGDRDRHRKDLSREAWNTARPDSKSLFPLCT